MRFITFTITLLISLTLAATDEVYQKMLKVVSNGKVVNNLPLEAVDYVDIYNAPLSPEEFEANVLKDNVELRWRKSGIKNVTYSIYRSKEGEDYELIQSGLTTDSYVDRHLADGRYHYCISTFQGEDESLRSEPIEVVVTNVMVKDGLYMGMAGGDTRISSTRIDLLDDNFSAYLLDFTKTLSYHSEATFYDAMYVALDSIQYADLPENLSNVYVVGILGPDYAGSKDKAVNKTDISALRAKLEERMKTDTKGGVSITGYMLGVAEEGSAEYGGISEDVLSLSTSPANASMHGSMADMNDRLLDIAGEITSYMVIQGQSVVLSVGGCRGGERLRLTFDRANEAEQSECYIEGTLDLVTGDLIDLKFVGIDPADMDRISGKRDGLFMVYPMDNLIVGANEIIVNANCTLWNLEDRKWVRNSKFELSDVRTDFYRPSAIVYFVIDPSGSFVDHRESLDSGLAGFISELNSKTGADKERQSALSGCKGRKEIRNVLFIGTSFFNHAASEPVGWIYEGGMAPSVPSHSLPQLILRGVKAEYPDAESHYISSLTWERGFDDFDFNSEWLPTLTSVAPDAIFLHISGNSVYSSTFYGACERLVYNLKTYCPSAEIYLAASWHGGDKAKAFKKACDRQCVSYVDLNIYKNPQRMWRAGDWYCTSPDTVYHGITEIACTHPNDMGCLLMANGYLKSAGFKPLNMAHSISLTSTGPGVVTTPSDVWPENGIVTLRLESGSVDSISVMTAAGEELDVTFRQNDLNPAYSDYYTFIMPAEDVEVKIEFKDIE